MDQLKTFDVSLWLRAWQTESASSEPFFPVQFENWADDILLTDLNILSNDVNAPYSYTQHLLQQEPPSFLYVIVIYQVRGKY